MSTKTVDIDELLDDHLKDWDPEGDSHPVLLIDVDGKINTMVIAGNDGRLAPVIEKVARELLKDRRVTQYALIFSGRMRSPEGDVGEWETNVYRGDAYGQRVTFNGKTSEELYPGTTWRGDLGPALEELVYTTVEIKDGVPEENGLLSELQRNDLARQVEHFTTKGVDDFAVMFPKDGSLDTMRISVDPDRNRWLVGRRAS